LHLYKKKITTVFKFITNRPFWVNLLAAIAIVAIVLFLFLQLLGVITKHGSYLTVPSVTKMPVNAAVKLLEDKGFDVVISDSVYTDTAKMGIVLKQFPEENSTVKVNRQVLLTVNRSTLPLLDMPALQGKSLSYALEILKRSHMVLGDTTFKPDFMMGSVLEQRFNGSVVASGAKVPWGSRIDLVIGAGLANENIPVPSLEGVTYSEAKMILEQNGITLGATIVEPGTRDTGNAFVYKQSPPKLNEDKQPMFIRSGQVMDLWISPVMKTITDSTNTTP
jgi:beta-lactam-binding protein with PASTA domain